MIRVIIIVVGIIAVVRVIVFVIRVIYTVVVRISNSFVYIEAYLSPIVVLTTLITQLTLICIFLLEIHRGFPVERAVYCGPTSHK